jgi:RHS repeat-associated protein
MTYDAAAGTFTGLTPEARQSVLATDDLGRIVALTDPDRDVVGYSYTAGGHPFEIRTGAGAAERVVQFAYTAQGFFAGHTDPLGRVTQVTQHDAIGRMRRLVLPGARTIDFTYDARGGIATVVAPSGQTHAFVNDLAGHVVQYTAPDAGDGPAVTQYVYDDDRLLVGIDHPGGDSVIIDRDGAGRIIGVELPTRTTTTTYHPTSGLISGHSAAGETLSYAWNGELLASETWAGTVDGTVARGHDNSFRMTSLVVAGQSFAYAYDDDDLVIGAGQLAITRDAVSGAIDTTALGSVTTSAGRNGFGETTSFAASFGATPLLAQTFTRDLRGRMTRKVETIGAAAAVTYDYAYSPEGWLTDVWTDSVLTEHYAYDGNGNRTGVTNSGGTAAATHDAQDRLLDQGGVDYAYTAEGHLLERTDGSDVTGYVYDLAGNLTEVTLADGTVITYAVDPLGRRIAKEVDGAPVQGFLYAGRLPVAELNGGGSVVAHFVYRADSHVPEYVRKAGINYRILTDPNGSVRLVVDAATGAVVQQLRYDAFGRILLDTNPGFQPFGFAGGLYDPHTGLSHFGARDYDADAGRFTAKDPIGFRGGDINLYAYVFNDPLNQVDPEGTRGSGNHGVFDPTGGYHWPNLPSPTSPPPSPATNNQPTRAATGAGSGTCFFCEQGPAVGWLNDLFPSTANIAAYCHERYYPNRGPIERWGNGFLPQIYVTLPTLIIGAPIEAFIRGTGAIADAIFPGTPGGSR